MDGIHTCLWLDREAEEAAEFYCALFPDSQILRTDRAPLDTPGDGPRAGDVLTVEFELAGRPFTALNGGPGVEFTDAVSLEVRCVDQAEIDHYWDGLLAGGGRPQQCGWLIDRYGVRWQVAPQVLFNLWRGDDRAAATRAFTAMTGMVRFDVAALEAAARG